MTTNSNTLLSRQLSITKHLPILFFFLFFTAVCSYRYFVAEAILEIGSANSTIGIGVILTPLYALFYGGIGFLVGFVLKRILLKVEVDFRTSMLRFSLAFLTLLSLICLVTAVGAYSEIEEVEKHNSPRVIEDSLALTKEPFDQAILSKTESHTAIEVLERRNRKNLEIEWNGNLIYADLKGGTALSLTNSESTSRTLDVSSFSYISRAEVMPLDKHLVVLTTLRPTSKRTMLFILDKDLNLVYQELLNRCVRLNEEQMHFDKSNNSLVIKACEPFKLNLK